MFSDDAYVDSSNPFDVELASTPYQRDGKPERERFQRGRADLVYTCGQLIVNGTPWTQVPYLQEVESEPASWTYIREKATKKSGGTAGRIYVHFDAMEPAEQRIEISTRRRIFAPHQRGLGHIVVEGFVLEHCGNQYPHELLEHTKVGPGRRHRTAWWAPLDRTQQRRPLHQCRSARYGRARR